MAMRDIILIDEEKCDGCGQCVTACAENAIEIVDGKAKLVGEIYCDGLGACIGECPQGAISIERREAAEFDESAVRDRVSAGLASCPGSLPRSMPTRGSTEGKTGIDQGPSMLGNWPVQLHLLPVAASWLKGADLLIAADCTPFAFAGFHERFIKDKVVVIACPKLDNVGPYLEKLRTIFSECGLRSVEVVYMEVPCCTGLVRLVKQALTESGSNLPLTLTRITIDGSIDESVSS